MAEETESGSDQEQGGQNGSSIKGSTAASSRRASTPHFDPFGGTRGEAPF